MIMEIYQISFRFFFLVAPFVFAVISIIYSIVNLKRQVFLNKNKRKSTGMVLMGVIIGIFFSRTIFDFEDIGGDVSSLVVALCIMTIACICALGTWNFVKIYYIKVLESQGINIEK